MCVRITRTEVVLGGGGGVDRGVARIVHSSRDISFLESA